MSETVRDSVTRSGGSGYPDRSGLVVNEIFGPTVQGEGPSAGRICAFVRLGGCNLSCRWCDTPYTWDWTGIASPVPHDPAEELHLLPVEEVADRIRATGVDRVIVSGGEPLNQQHRLVPLLELLSGEAVTVEVETNGTHEPVAPLARLVDRFVVSPKLSHSGDSERRRISAAALRSFRELGKSDFKFVVTSPEDLREVDGIVAANSLRPVWIMPEGRDVDTLVRNLSAVADEVVRRKWNLTGRLHILAWNDVRGV
ncbi:7-carboxy-7-deazaguanine synthase QueE [Actinopolyspora erythraea]|uniref:7-carboxy-7-deazaguanine synthase n=1 Tax=Actinopolyspora erythraea TaxID=414996 RepID=A0A223RSS8_9ACTN|nr:7-carboxy-7-deazaguanine synthase QueE [Actinopolyspora erythraea]ASU78923.1 7-carboxy-7-deazaguanine synthase QueE [Actinopolyspora erythraea]